MITDEKIRIQITFHLLNLIKVAVEKNIATIQEKEIYTYCLNYANKFHRTDVERLPLLSEVENEHAD
jgi:hypothetical protein